MHCVTGYAQVPESCACRVVFLLAYLLSAIIIPSYSASLISSLTAQTPNRPFDSLKDMLAFKRYKLLLAKNSAEYSHFAVSTWIIWMLDHWSYPLLYSRVATTYVAKTIQLARSACFADNAVLAEIFFE